MAGMGLVQRSIYGGVLILVILAVRAALLGRLPKRTFPILWCVALLRLLLPISVSSGFSVYSLMQSGQEWAKQEDTTYGTTGNLAITDSDSPDTWTAFQNPAMGEGMPVAVSVGAKPIPVLSIVWCMGAILCAAFFGLAYLSCLRRFRKAMPVEDMRIRRWMKRYNLWHRLAVRQSDKISAPLTYGIIRPVILLPERLAWESDKELEYVLQHEYVHICHCDAAVKLVMIAALCIHWFNPLVWLMSVLLNRDIELACDEGVLRRFGEQSRAGYAMALIGMEEKKRGLLPLYNGFSKNAIEERIRLIMKYKKITYMTCVSALLLVFAIVLVFATSAKPTEATDNPGISGNMSGEDMADIPLDPPAGSMGSGMGTPGDSGHANGSESVPNGGNGENGKKGGNRGDEESKGSEESGENEGSKETAGSQYTLSYMQEGLPEEEPADLYAGDGYRMLIPKEGWQLYAPDAWAWKENELVQFWVSDCSGSTRAQEEARLQADGYSQPDERGVLARENDGRFFFALVKEEGFRVKCLYYTYPSDSEHMEGIGALLRAVAVNFAVMPGEDGEALSEEGRQIKQMTLAFWEAYLAGNSESVRKYLAEDYDYNLWGVEVFPDGVDGHVAQEVQVRALKGLGVGECAVGESLEIWVEFCPAAGADYLEYLGMTVTKEQDGWKVLSYGLEM